MADAAKLPEFSLTDLAGGARKFPSGRHALLCFVKEDCATCQMTMPLIECAHAAFASKLDVLAIGQDAEGNAKLVETHHLKTPMLDDSTLHVSFAYGLDTVPTIILATPDGTEMRRFVGFDKPDWQNMMDESRACRASRYRASTGRSIRNSARVAGRNQSSRKSRNDWRPKRAAIG